MLHCPDSRTLLLIAHSDWTGAKYLNPMPLIQCWWPKITLCAHDPWGWRQQLPSRGGSITIFYLEWLVRP